MNQNKNMEYILDEIVARGFNINPRECNDFSILLQRKDFKDLIALEIYESFFWEDRHEFDLQLLKEIVDSVSAFFSDPETIIQIKTGFMQTLPSAIVVTMTTAIWNKLKTIPKNKNKEQSGNSSWTQIEKNIKRIDEIFSIHDYILTNEIESMFDASREEIQPLLKLCGCKCYIDNKRSIWLKVGLSEDKGSKVLKEHKFKRRK